MSTNWRPSLQSAIREARMTDIIGRDDIKNMAHTKVAIAVIKAFGQSPAGFIYFEPCTPRSTSRPPDVLVCHPDLGVLIIEVKGWTLDQIQRIVAGNFHLMQRGKINEYNPFRQAENAMYDIKDSISRMIRSRRNEPLLSYMVAFPNISETNWSAEGYTESAPNEQLLFKEHTENPGRLRQRAEEHIKNNLTEFRKDTPLNADHIPMLQRIFGDSAVINEKRPPRIEVEESSLGAKLDESANLDKLLSKEQKQLSRLPVEGYPRLIRGVAGSGKTVVLANMAARYMNRVMAAPDDMFEQIEKDYKIAIICFNRALVSMLKRKVADSFLQQTLDTIRPGWVDVTHWNGLWWNFGKQHIVDYIPANTNPSVRAQDYSRQLDKFAKANPEWFNELKYDAIFVDEGQDFEPEEFQLMMKLIKTEPKTNEKNLIIFYDDAQNLYARQRPVWKDVGIDVQRGDRSKIMKQCFRNSKEIVELAFNVLLGVQTSDDKRVQTRTFADLNYLKQINLVEEIGDHFRVKFTDRNGDKPIIKTFPNRQEEKEWIVSEISRLVEDEHVRPEDILVLHHVSTEFKNLSSLIEIETPSIKGFIKPHENKDDKNRYIFRKNFLTLSSTHSAKGYDASIVFLVGADRFDDNDIKSRASFYVGSTRAKMLLYISGIHSKESLLNEAEKILEIL